MPVAHLLIIDQDAARQSRVRDVARFMGCESVSLAAAAADLGDGFDASPVSAALIGQPAAEDDLLRDLRALRALDPGLPVFVYGARAAASADRDRLVLGWLEFPLTFAELNSAFDRAQAARAAASAGGRPLELFRSLVGNSRSIEAVRRLIEQVAGSEASVLILGESGTGKEVVARNIHYQSPRRDAPFVTVNCGAIHPELLDAELFGHPGAAGGTARAGRFGMAEGGTLFLDEVADMSPPMQIKLLRVLQDRTYEPMGSGTAIAADVRIIAATHSDLEAGVGNGTFRRDLYYRLNVFPIEMPPLRERSEDIPLLIGELIKRLEHEKRGSLRLTPPAVLALCAYPWPGNVRELANLVERLAIMYPCRLVDLPDLPAQYRSGQGGADPSMPGGAQFVPMDWMSTPRLPRGGLDLKDFLGNLEYSLIRQALAETDGVVARAARLLRMRRTTLVEKLRKYGHAAPAREHDRADVDS